MIDHWWEEKANSSAAIKAFITTKTGDVPFLFGIFTLVFATGTSNIQAISRCAQLGVQLRRSVLTHIAPPRALRNYFTRST